jgi:hypothetical protein
MNKYLISFIEIIILAAAAKFSAKNIDIFTGDESIVNLNYIFWGIIMVLSVLVNFHLFIYFGTVFILGVVFLAIYIHKIVRVITFVESDYNLFFWMLFVTLFIPIFVILITKRVLYSAFSSEAPQGYVGPIGNVGDRGENYFIESAGDRAYVLIVTGIEKYFREILDKNEIDYDANIPQFNNMYLKENLKRICNSREFIESILTSSNTENLFCAKISSMNDSRFCSSVSDNFTVPNTPSTTIPCVSNKDCYTLNTMSENQNLANLLVLDGTQNELNNIFIRVKYWIRLILENNCEQDKKLREKLKIQTIYKLSEINMGFVDSFREFQEDTSNQKLDTHHEKDTHLTFNNINHLRMNNLLGRKFLQSDFQNHKYWQNNNVKTINRNPFDIIHQDPIWNWGSGVGDPCRPTDRVSGQPNSCSIKPHAKTPI